MNEIHVQSTDGMKITGENLSTQKKTCPKDNLSTTNPTRASLGSYPYAHILLLHVSHIMQHVNKTLTKNRLFSQLTPNVRAELYRTP
jgi:hypothetical protein